MLISTRAQLSKNALVLKNDFNPTEDQLEQEFLLPHIVCFESYVSAFQVIYQTRETVFHRDIQTPRRELKIRRAAEYF